MKFVISCVVTRLFALKKEATCLAPELRAIAQPLVEIQHLFNHDSGLVVRAARAAICRKSLDRDAQCRPSICAWARRSPTKTTPRCFREPHSYRACQVVIPPGSNRKTKRHYSRVLYRTRNIVERFFNRIKCIKYLRRVTTRFDKLAGNYLAFAPLACTFRALVRM